MYKQGKGTPVRNPYWSKELFLSDLEQAGNIKRVCEIYADEQKGWRAYYTDVSRWRKEDPMFDQKVKAILSVSDSSQGAGPGRTPIDQGDKSWWGDFCDELYNRSGNRQAASLVTPYSFKTILDMLNPETTSYNKEFAEMVEVTEAEISAEVEEMFLDLRKPENFETFEAAKIAQTKAWYATKVLEKLDKKRYGRFIEVKGKMTHEHSHQLLPPSERMFNLWEEQKKFLEKKAQFMLEDGKQSEVIDAEEVPAERSLDS